MKGLRYLLLWVAGGFALPAGCIAELHRADHDGLAAVSSVLMPAWMMWTFPGDELSKQPTPPGQ